MMTQVAILGAGAHAREMFWHVRDTWPGAQVCFVDDVSDRTSVLMAETQVPVVKDWRFPPGCGQFLIGVGDPHTRQALVQRALDAGLTPAPTLVHPRALIQAPDVRLGVGGMIAPGCILTTNIALGDFVLLNLNATVAHDCRLGDYVTCNAGCHLSGNVVLGEGVYMGAGSVVREGLSIAPWITVGAQGCVVKDLNHTGATYAGIPAKLLRTPEAQT